MDPKEEIRNVTSREIFESDYLSQHSVCIGMAAEQTEKILAYAEQILKYKKEKGNLDALSMPDILSLASIISAQTAQLNITWDKNLTRIDYQKKALQDKLNKK